MIYVYTFKDGILARLAHNLRLHVEAPDVKREGDAVTVSFHVNQLHIDGTIDKHGALNPNELTEANKTDITANITKEIFHHAPHVRFEGRINDLRLVGELTLGDQTHPVVVDLKEDPAGLSGVLNIVPSAWGIAPYKTMGGAIKLKDHLRVMFTYATDS